MLGLAARFQVRHLYPVLPLALYALIVAGPVTDNSFLWHVRAGAVQSASTRVITVDPFSFTASGEPWRTQSWIAELLYASLSSIVGGVGWAPMFVGVVGVGALCLGGLTIYSASRSSLATAGWLIVVVWLLAPFDQPRPVIFSYLLLAAMVLILALKERVLWVVVPILWLWAGLHASWLIGIGLLALEALRRRSWKLVAILGVSIVAVSATAHGLGVWTMVFSFAANSGALDYIEEWQPPDFGGFAQAPFVLIIAGVLAAAVKGRIQMRALWIILPFLTFGLMTRRFVPVATLVLVPFAALGVYLPSFRASARWTPVPFGVLALIASLVIAVHVQLGSELDRHVFPGDTITELASGRRVFHDDAVGGYLIYREGPQHKVYIDDRAELYGAEGFADFRAARSGDYEALFDRLAIEAAIVRSSWPLRSALIGNGWYVEHREEDFELLLPGINR